LLATPHSSYFYKWNPADGAFYLDPNDQPQRLINGNVVTPAVMTATYPLALLPYPVIRILWSLFQVIALIATIYLLFKRKNISSTILAASPIIISLVCSDIWLYNIDRGQMYVFYTFLFALMYYLYISKLKYNEFLSGVVGGLFILFRPFTGIAGLGFLLLGRKKWIAGCAVGFVAGILLFVLPQPKVWQDYFAAMKEYVNENLNTGHWEAKAVSYTKPVSIEGSTNIPVYESFYIGNLNPYHNFLLKRGITVNMNMSLILYAAGMIFLSWLFFRIRKKIAGPDILFLFGFFGYILAELAIPAPRGAYNMIMWIFPLSLIYLRARSNIPLLVILALAMLLLHGFPFYFPLQGQLPEIMFLFLTAFVVFFPKATKDPSIPGSANQEDANSLRGSNPI
jgi:hypothetical protein